MTPGNGLMGIEMSSEKRTSPNSLSIWKVLRKGSVATSGTKPPPSLTIVQPHPRSSSSIKVTARTSPGSAPST